MLNLSAGGLADGLQGGIARLIVEQSLCIGQVAVGRGAMKSPVAAAPSLKTAVRHSSKPIQWS